MTFSAKFPNADFTEINRYNDRKMRYSYSRYEREGHEAAREGKPIDYAMTIMMDTVPLGLRAHIARKYWRMGWYEGSKDRKYFHRYGRARGTKMRILTLSGAQEVVKTGKVEDVEPIFVEDDSLGAIDVEILNPC